MMSTIQIYDVLNVEEKTDVEVLRELAKKTYANCRKITTAETYESEEPDNTKFYGNGKYQLGKLENILVESAELLERNISYRPEKELLRKMILDLYSGREHYYNPLLISDVINDVVYFEEDEELLKAHEEDPVFHMEYIISKFKPMVNIICKVLKDNDLEGRLYRD